MKPSMKPDNFQQIYEKGMKPVMKPGMKPKIGWCYDTGYETGQFPLNL